MPIENKVRTIGFRASKSERAFIEKQARKMNLRISTYIRLCVLNDMASRQPKAPEAAK